MSKKLTIKQYAAMRGIGKGYIHRLVQTKRLDLMPDVSKIEQKIDPHGVSYYTITLKKQIPVK